MSDDTDECPSRRQFLLAGLGVTGLAGCTGLPGGDGGGGDGGAPATTANVSLVDTETAAGGNATGEEYGEGDTATGGSGDGGTTTQSDDGQGDGSGDTTAQSSDGTDGGGTTSTAGTDAGRGGGLGDSAPMYQYDAANTGYNPAATGPTSSVAEAWSFETGESIFDPPSVVDGTVYVGSGDGTVYALDRAGEERWSYDAPAPVARTAVVDGRVVLGYGREQDEHKGFLALSTDGEKQWSVAADSQPVGAPTVHDGTVYVTGYYGDLYAIDAASGDLQWSVDTSAETPATPSVADGTVYLGVQNAVQAYDAASGERRWTFDVEGDANFTTAAPAATDGAVFFGDSEGTLRAVEADGTERWSAGVADFTSSSPAVADGAVYLGATTMGDSNTASVYAYDVADGSEAWSTGIPPSLVSAPVIAGGTLYVSGSMFDVHALTTDGETLWSSPETEGGAVDLVPPPAVAEDTVYVGSYDNSVYALRAE